MHELISVLQRYALESIMTIKFVSITNKNRSLHLKKINSLLISEVFTHKHYGVATTW